MIEIDKMELADIGGDPIKLAAAILRQIPNIKIPIPINEIAKALGIIEIKAMDGSDFSGGLITDQYKNSGCILYNKSHEHVRQRFTIVHELGHFINPWHNLLGQNNQIMCTSQNMTAATFDKNNLQQKMEVEANQFAAELLMPKVLLKKEIRSFRSIDIQQILSLAEKYEVSKSSMAHRCADIQDDPSAVIISKDGEIKSIYKNKDFPTIKVQKTFPLPPTSLAAKFKGNIGDISDWSENKYNVWLSSDNICKTIHEQVLIQQNGYKITLLNIGEISDEEEENLVENYNIQFRR